MQDEITIKCECGTEMMHVELQDPCSYEDGLYFSIWMHAYNRISFWSRFRHMWQILRYGRPYGDQICLDYEAVKILNRWLDHYLANTRSEITQNELKKNDRRKCLF